MAQPNPVIHMAGPPNAFGNFDSTSEATLIGRLSIVGNTVPTEEGYGLFGFGVVPGLATLNVVDEAGVKFLRGHYNAGNDGGTSIYGGCNLDQVTGTREVYIQYYARMPNTKHGLKNVKLFGIRNGANYANATFSFDYTDVDNGCFRAVQFGDGTDIENDSNNIILFDGTHPEYVGRSYSGAVISTPQNANFDSTDWGTGWHKIQLMFRHNTGNSPETEIANGATKVIIDDVVYVDADNLLTRHYSNGYFQGVGLFGITQNNPGFAFDFDIREGLTVSTGRWID